MTTNLQQLRDERQALELQVEIARLRASQRLMESAPVLESWSELNYVDPREWRTDDWGRPLLPGGGDDRSGGRNGPVFETEQDLARIRAAARWLADSSPAAIGVLKNLTNYVMGAGFKYTVGSKREAPANLIAAVQQALDDFLDDNDWPGDLEHELFRRAHRDGEYFVRLYDAGGGRVAVRVIEPEQVREPDVAQASRHSRDPHPNPLPEYRERGAEGTSWSFGVHTPAADVQTVLGYHVCWRAGSASGEYVPADEMEHARLNVDRNVKRGVSDFYAVEAQLEGAAKLLRNTWEGAAIQAAIAYIREHAPGAASSGIEAWHASQADYSHTQRGQRTTYVHRYDPGTIIDVPRGQEYKPSPLGSAHGPNFLAIEQAVLRAVGVRWCMPEYMVSGDASNANFASTLVAESPFVKNAEAEQRFFISRFQRIVWKALRIAADAGRFRRYGAGYAELLRSIEIQIAAPTIAVRNRHEETQTRALLHQAGVLSKQTWAAQEGLDWELEKRSERGTN